MPWIVASLLFLSGVTVLLLAQKRALQEFTKTQVIIFPFAGLALAGFVVALIGGHSLALTSSQVLLLVAMGLASFVGNMGEMTAVKHAPNPGYAGTAVTMAAALMTVSAPFFEQSTPRAVQLLGVGIVVVSSVLLWFVPREKVAEPTESAESKGWLIALVITAVAFAGMGLLMKSAASSLSVWVLTPYLALAIVANATIASKLAPQGAADQNGGKPARRSRQGKFALAVVCGAVLFSLYMELWAIQLAPNPGYPFAVSAAKGALVCIVAPFFFPDVKFNVKGFGAMVLALIGMACMALG